ncbi:MAG: hypothetical protein IKQ83_00015 [Lachnospiraceae bacterium]|nr:hypothetical protein [Lachnospiraceae bacterium]
MSIDKNTDRKVNTRKTMLGILGFVTVIALCIIARFVYGRYLIYELDLAYRITPMDAYYDPARIGENGYIYCDYFSLRGMYLTLCSCAYKLMGNLDGTIILLNIFIEVLAVILIWFAVKRIFGRLAAFIISIICALAPYWGEIPWFWGGTCYYILFRENRLIFLAAAFGLWILSLIVGAIRSSASGSEKPDSAEPVESEDAEPVITDAETEVKVEEAEPVVKTEEAEPVTQTKAHEPEEPVELLISPLPLPKRHEHKDIDYDHDISDDDMKYDVEPADADLHYDYE